MLESNLLLGICLWVWFPTLSIVINIFFILYFITHKVRILWNNLYLVFPFVPSSILLIVVSKLLHDFLCGEYRAILNPWVRKMPFPERSKEKERLPNPIFLPREPHEQRSLAVYNLWGHKELAMTEWLNMHTHGEPVSPLGVRPGSAEQNSRQLVIYFTKRSPAFTCLASWPKKNKGIHLPMKTEALLFDKAEYLNSGYIQWRQFTVVFLF